MILVKIVAIQNYVGETVLTSIGFTSEASKSILDQFISGELEEFRFEVNNVTLF